MSIFLPILHKTFLQKKVRDRITQKKKFFFWKPRAFGYNDFHIIKLLMPTSLNL
jgi:hypothetical protein